MLGAFLPSDDILSFGQAGRLEIIGDLVKKVHVDDMFIGFWRCTTSCLCSAPDSGLRCLSPPNLPSSVSAALALIALTQVNCCPVCGSGQVLEEGGRGAALLWVDGWTHTCYIFSTHTNGGGFQSLFPFCSSRRNVI